MIKMAKITDYGIVLLTYFARIPQEKAYSARELAQESGLPLPVVSKILKGLAREKLLVSERGAHGGYRLARKAEDISLAEVIRALEGPIVMTECVEAVGLCHYEVQCPIRHNWSIINEAVNDALSKISLSQMRQPWSPPINRQLQPVGRNMI